MHYRIRKMFFTVLGVTLLCSNPAIGADKVLQFNDGSGSSTSTAAEGNPIIIEIHVDDQDKTSGIAGAAFTVNYDSTKLHLANVTSNFFGTFVAQGILDEATPCVTVDNEEYCSPLADNQITTGSMLAAARVDEGIGENVIFTLQFDYIGGPLEDHTANFPISIIPSTIFNTDAGYDAGGTEIPLLVGIGDTQNPYPSYTVATPVNGNISITAADIDVDGIADFWELIYSEGLPGGSSLDIFTINGDEDGDGYSDLQEYLNDKNGETDPDGIAYNPVTSNVAGGTGYIPPTSSSVGGLPAIIDLIILEE